MIDCSLLDIGKSLNVGCVSAGGTERDKQTEHDEDCRDNPEPREPLPADDLYQETG